MKKVMIAAVICGLAYSAYAQGLPRLAVVAFTPNVSTAKIKEDAAAIRNLAESRMASSGKYQVISREEIDQLLESQRIQVSDISSKENIAKLQRQNISYIVTVSVDVVENEFFISVSILDVSSGQFQRTVAVGKDESPGEGELFNWANYLLSVFMDRKSSRKEYKLGDIGPAGGIVFYDKGVFSDGWRYLEAAPAGTEFTAQWGATGKDVAGTDVAGTDTAVGSGTRNTQVIVERFRQLGESGSAAQLCASLDFNSSRYLSLNGYKDWFLPSKDELNLMYQNLKKKGFGGFSDGWYWSSSQDDTDYAWHQRFSDGAQDYYDKFYAGRVRAVRAF